MKGSEVHEGTFANGKLEEGPPVAPKSVGSLALTYTTAEGKCPELTPSKVVQRSELADKVDGGTVLEAYAGKGNLTDTVYAKAADKVVLVDKNQQALNRATAKLKGKVKTETVCMDNTKWLENEMSPSELHNLKLIDFDAFGSPADPMKAFFKRFPVKHKMFVAVTDGSKSYIGFNKGAAAKSWLRRNYGIDLNASGSREDQVRILDNFMQVLGRHHGFNVKPINAGFGKQLAVYAGYQITPK
jgi:tRNA G26 N,N-dimethylase Trm1